MMFTVQFNPTVDAHSYTQDARRLGALRSGTARDAATPANTPAIAPALGAIRAKSPLLEDQFQPTVQPAKSREGSTNGAVVRPRSQSSSSEHYGLVENAMVGVGALFSNFLPR
jgi:hypothetical protein